MATTATPINQNTATVSSDSPLVHSPIGVQFLGNVQTDGPAVWRMICLGFGIDPNDTNAFVDVLSRVPTNETIEELITTAINDEATARENADALLTPLANSGASNISIDGSTSSIKLSSAFPIIPVECFGVVNDSDGSLATANTTAYLKALQACAGKYTLYHRPTLSVYVNSTLLPGALDRLHWIMEGTLTLYKDANCSIVDITGLTNFKISGNKIGIIDGNKANQTGGYPTYLGGFVSNMTGTQDTTTGVNTSGQTVTIPPMPISATTKVTTGPGVIEGFEIINIFNWPISLSGINDVIVQNNDIHGHNSSCQFFDSSNRCQFNYNHVYNSPDAGFVFYRGNSYGVAMGNIIHECSQGINSYAEYDNLPLDKALTISDNIVYSCVGTGIGITTSDGGASSVALQRQRILISNNLLYNNNTGNSLGQGSIGIVGAQGVLIDGNLIFDDGSTTAVNAPYSIYVDNRSAFIDISNNQIGDCGSLAVPGVCIYLNSPNNCSVTNNTGYATQSTSGPTGSLLGGGFGAGCFMHGNLIQGDIKNSWDEMDKPSDLLYEQRRDSSNLFAISNGVAVASGNLYVEEGNIVLENGYVGETNYYGATAQGTTQSTAQGFSQQNIIVTSGATDAGVLLPTPSMYGVEYTICNRTGNTIKIYPPVSGQIEGLGENVGVDLENTVNMKIFAIYSSTYTGGQWYGYKMVASTTGIS